MKKMAFQANGAAGFLALIAAGTEQSAFALNLAAFGVFLLTVVAGALMIHA